MSQKQNGNKDDTLIPHHRKSNVLKLGTQVTDNRIYSQFVSVGNNRVLCSVSKEGRIIKDGIDITDNDSSLAACFIEYLQTQFKLTIKRG